ncbi:unnamed protein product [Protopolystoma xenopodis]|uniref:Uncharacterized protein n=1 Tax=Protopolystoma xenopodis TaxID=117903 RepID=A0A3S5CPI5_9PLAT|nr:unnamed protein product [Protopolystoma xenopodis]
MATVSTPYTYRRDDYELTIPLPHHHHHFSTRPFWTFPLGHIPSEIWIPIFLPHEKSVKTTMPTLTGLYCPSTGLSNHGRASLKSGSLLPTLSQFGCERNRVLTSLRL